MITSLILKQEDRNIPRGERRYPFCKPDIVEDEYHALLVRRKYSDLRNIFFNKIGNSNEIHNMSSTEKLPLIFSNNDLTANLYAANFKFTDERYILTKSTW